MLKHYYHIWCGNEVLRGWWQVPVKEHLEALETSGLLKELDFIGVGLIGSAANRAAVREVLPENFVVVYEDSCGWEQVTMESMDISGDDKILYAHTKGAAYPSPNSTNWRRSMTAGVVLSWQKAVDLLDETADAVGIYWRVANVHTAPQHYSGTFWWANSDYLRKLPMPIPCNSRWDAEMWIGQGPSGSRMYDLNFGGPTRNNWMHQRPTFEENGIPAGFVKFIANARVLGYRPGQMYVVPSTPYLEAALDKGVHLQRISSRDEDYERLYILP